MVASRAARAGGGRPIAGRSSGLAAGLLRARPLRGGALLRPVGPADPARRGSRSSTPGRELATALGALWPAIWIAAAWPIALVEMAYAQMARAPRLEVGRIRDAMYSGLGLAVRAGLRLQRSPTSRPSATRRSTWPTSAPPAPARSSRKIVRTLDQPLEVADVLPRAGNEVREEVDNYLQRPGAGVGPAHDHALRLRHRSAQGQGVRHLHATARWCSCAARATSCSACPSAVRERQATR